MNFDKNRLEWLNDQNEGSVFPDLIVRELIGMVMKAEKVIHAIRNCQKYEFNMLGTANYIKADDVLSIINEQYGPVDNLYSNKHCVQKQELKRLMIDMDIHEPNCATMHEYAIEPGTSDCNCWLVELRNELDKSEASTV